MVWCLDLVSWVWGEASRCQGVWFGGGRDRAARGLESLPGGTGFAGRVEGLDGGFGVWRFGNPRHLREGAWNEWLSARRRLHRSGIERNNEAHRRRAYSHQSSFKSFCRSQLPHTSVNLSFSISNTKNRLTDSCGNWLFMNTVCEIKFEREALVTTPRHSLERVWTL